VLLRPGALAAGGFEVLTEVQLLGGLPAALDLLVGEGLAAHGGVGLLPGRLAQPPTPLGALAALDA
jgi:hypothetical protein